MARVKKKDHERLDDSNIEKVIKALNDVPPITKTEACKRLNISYNTKRLASIIEEYEGRKATEQRLRKANRGKAAQPHEIQTIISDYLSGDPVGSIADSIYRPVSFVKGIVDRVGIPERGGSYFEPKVVPDQCMSDTFRDGQVVWSFKHDSMAIVVKQEFNVSDKENNIYRIYVIEKIEEQSPYFRPMEYGGFYATMPAYELGSLEHLKDYGVDIYKPYRGHFEWLEGR